ncbi:uncharacterized protein LOC129179453 [Dunckerocampus dactyliophorus]|uniref:uncharacterized protein LOC129168013 n=1 Tax=Dunckerocampus dactyliophorus TaxID=161453 RepID=UPI002404C981|nr:uncharacterized protein LOC129168013 [Dunckerocampus dactyliophorus]XP_054613275.1 uncharacterized protein LOC129170074 [Dunckerocampus dactyliophorus]XP_054618064.1 uncharacterized protein LOC129172404 [Dunckerocampus dactyliophorus]XP_054621885.1 uncharacterized protein LOC129174191 [Dunckerocampus dactyliophorus]XP_054628662.1 uncharacterized protein LOC129179453 [Dunckerocampus dactyliophorus]
MADREKLSEAIGLLNNILNSPTVITTMSEMLDQRRQTPTGASSNATVEEEMRRIFRASSSGVSGSASSTSSGSSLNQVMQPRYRTQQYFGGWASKSRKRPTALNHPTFNKDIILLPDSTWDEVCKHKTKRRLHERGYILSAFEMRKMWDCRTVIAEIREAFKDRIPEDVSIDLLMACGNKLVSPKLREGQELNGFMIHKVFKSKAVYIRPSTNLPFPSDSTDSEDSCVEVDATSASSDHSTSQTSDCMTTRARGNQTASIQQISSYPFTRRARANQLSATQQASSDVMTRANQPSSTQQTSSDVMTRANQPSSTQQTSSDVMTRANQPSATQQTSSDVMTRANQPSSTHEASSVIDLDSVGTVNQTPSASDDNYAAYLSIMGSISDLSSDDEEVNQAIMASPESHVASEHINAKSAQEVLLNLASLIDSNKRCRFNINRSSVLDGALRGFRRLSYNPKHQMCIKFSDDLGMNEEAVDLGGPRREFLRLLMEALVLSPMFEGRDDKLNLALDSSALREDKYFIAGQAIAVSLVHGGPPPGFIAPTLYSCLVGGSSSVKPVLEDIADTDRYEKVKKVSECTSLDDLINATEPLQDYLANAGCLRPLKCIEDRDLLVKDILMFQVVHRVCGAFERFKEGLKTLGVLDAIRMHPDSFRPLMCHEPSPLTADLMDHLFHIRLSAVGSNKRRAEERVVPFWRDYLQDVEEQEGSSKLGKILAFATGASVIPPVGFSPQPSVDFLHDQPVSSRRCLPMANTCINCLKLPLLDTYEDFRESMDFALGNTQGFGRE